MAEYTSAMVHTMVTVIEMVKAQVAVAVKATAAKATARHCPATPFPPQAPQQQCVHSQLQYPQHRGGAHALGEASQRRRSEHQPPGCFSPGHQVK